MAGEKILLVDDEEAFVEALSARMEARGLVVDVANNGALALERARQAKYDAIILDLAMPGMDGIEVLRVLHAEQPELQVILLTGHATLAKGVEAMKLGAMDFLEKPVDLNFLLSKIQEAKQKTTQTDEEKVQQMISDIMVTKGW